MSERTKATTVEQLSDGSWHVKTGPLETRFKGEREAADQIGMLQQHIIYPRDASIFQNKE